MELTMLVQENRYIEKWFLEKKSQYTLVWELVFERCDNREDIKRRMNKEKVLIIPN